MPLLLALLSFAHAADLGARDLSGAPVTLTRTTAVVYWSMDCAACVAALTTAAGVGLPVVAVSTDPASARARLRPFLASRGLDLTVVADPAGDLRRRLGPPADGQALVVDASGAVVERVAASDLADRLAVSVR